MNNHTGIKDIDGKEILVGMYLQNMKCEYLTYQVRIRNNKYVVHTGGSYRDLLVEDAFQNLRIVNSFTDNILGLGANLFNSLETD